MEATKKQVLKNSLLYSTGNLLLKVFSFLLIPLYTAYLLPEQYGVLNIAVSFVNVASCIVMCGLQYSVVRFYADFKNNKEEVASMMGTIISFIALAGGIFSILLILSEKLWVKLLFYDIQFFPVVFLAILISLVSGLYGVYQEALKGMQKSRKSLLLSYIFFFLLLGSNILTVVVLKLGASGILLSTLGVNIVMVLLMYVDLKKNKLIKIGINFGLLYELLKYSLPQIPHSLSYNISSFITRLVINSKLSTSILGLFSLATQFGYVSDIVCNSVQSAFQPWVFNRLKELDSGQTNTIAAIRDTTQLLLLLNGLVFLLIGVCSKTAIGLMASSEYITAWQYVPPIVLVIALKSPQYFYQNFLYYDKTKTKYIFMITMIGCGLVILFNFILVPVWGIYGSIFADLIGLIVRTILIIKIAILYKNTKLIYSIRWIYTYTLVPVVWLIIAVIPSYLNLFEYGIDVLFKICCIVGYIGLLFILYRKNIIQKLKLKI